MVAQDFEVVLKHLHPLGIVVLGDKGLSLKGIGAPEVKFIGRTFERGWVNFCIVITAHARVFQPVANAFDALDLSSVGDLFKTFVSVGALQLFFGVRDILLERPIGEEAQANKRCGVFDLAPFFFEPCFPRLVIKDAFDVLDLLGLLRCRRWLRRRL
jgi:hypothetical protein